MSWIDDYNKELKANKPEKEVIPEPVEFEMSEAYLRPKLGDAAYDMIVSQIKELVTVVKEGKRAKITKIY